VQKHVKFDATGKIVLSHIYDQPDPRAYFSTLKHLEYTIPQAAKPVFQHLIAARRTAREATACKVVDVGCSYGVNGALLKFDLDMDDLYALYGSDAAHSLDRDALLARDRETFKTAEDPDLEIVGVDQAASAVAYAVEAGALDDGVAADFETATPTLAQAAKLADADLIISTGCYGYISQTSLARIMEPSRQSQPWMAHFVLRMFPFDGAREMLAANGYTTEHIAGIYPQRRFASDEERANAFANLARLGITPTRKEREGWYVAELHLSRPAAEARAIPAEKLLEGVEADVPSRHAA
jgi:TPR repeat protein